ncbi:MAG: hypothetical protein ACWGMZ_06750, partial [Thermoguttaceae bacterium]
MPLSKGSFFSAFGKFSIEPLFLLNRGLPFLLGLTLAVAWVLWRPASATTIASRPTKRRISIA